MPAISLTPEITSLIASGSPVALGVSGGKDSGALALAMTEYLDSVGHPREKRVLIHADLGLIEWPESLEWCEKLSAKLDIPLVVVARKAGGMIERWEKRWTDNFARYNAVECLRVILPWSTASMRFCTSELKTDVICSALRKRFAGEVIISATGVRADESAKRAKAPIAQPQRKLLGKRAGTRGLDWNPILGWTLEDVLAIHKRFDFPLHPAYKDYGSSRVSCAFCILATAKDQTSALGHPHNRLSYVRLCELELVSGFSFQGNRWLCDLAPELREELMPGSGVRLANAKALAELRAEQEAKLPKELNFAAGMQWPPRVIDMEEADLIADVRNSIRSLYGLTDVETAEKIYVELNGRVFANRLKVAVQEEKEAIKAEKQQGLLSLAA